MSGDGNHHLSGAAGDGGLRPDDAPWSAGQPIRFFISYRRRAAVDQELAHFLRQEFENANHEVFIDVGMPVGTDWVAEITRRIEWCDFLVVLLSEDAIHSEMVQAEIRLAHRRRSRDGRPALLPVRVCYDGPLDYELDSVLHRIQYVR